MSSRVRWAPVGVALAVFALSGCSPSSITVKGTIKKNGAPMVVSKDTMVTVMFSPQVSDDRAEGVKSHSAKFNQETGTYSVDLPPGKYKLSVSVAMPPQKEGGRQVPLPPYKPETVYDLTKSQDLDIEMPAK
jgi:hypothetical protein